MLYTVSGVQILATLDAFDELEARMTGGRERIGQCTFVSLRGLDIAMLMASRHCQSPGSRDRHFCW